MLEKDREREEEEVREWFGDRMVEERQRVEELKVWRRSCEWERMGLWN